MFSTQVLPEDISESDEKHESPSVVGFLCVENEKYEVRKGETKIGRDSTLCSVVIDYDTISKVHAVIESEGVDDSFVYDVGSTNQTKLGKKVLKPHCRYKLDHETILTFGNVSAKFLFPSSASDNLNPLDELGDIFDLPTQVTLSHPSGSHDKSPEKCFNFKIPNSPKVKESPQQNIKSEVLENSNIFSLDTQCQIYEPEIVSRELNDGQDDVLFSFMSLNFPKVQNESLKETKTEVESSSIPGGEFKIPNTSASLNCKVKQNNSPHILEEIDFIETQEFNFKINNTSSRGNDKKTEPVTGDNFQIKEEIEEEILTQVFDAFEKSQEKTTTTNIIPETEEYNISQDFKEAHVFDIEKEIPKEIKPEGCFSQKNSQEDFIETQIFDPKGFEDSIDINNDFIASQPNKPENVGNSPKVSSRESSPDLLCSGTWRSSEDCKIFDLPEPPNSKKNYSSHLNDESSGDETESDLEIIAEQNVPVEKFCKTEIESEISMQSKSLGTEDEDSYVFHLETENLSELCDEQKKTVDSDATDCEEIPCLSGKVSVKEEFPEYEGTQVLTLSLPDNYVEHKRIDSDSDVTDCEEIARLSPKVCVKEEVPEYEGKQVLTTLPLQKEAEDSDATDCEEIPCFSPKVSVKKEFPEYEGTQVLTMTLPDNYAEHKTTDSDSDVTDCEEVLHLSPKACLKKEFPQYEGTQVLTMTLPDNYAEHRTDSDSDVTDCEEVLHLSPKACLKKEFPQYEGTQVLTLPDNYSKHRTADSDCEEIPNPKSPVKENIPQYENTQVLTLTLPDNYAEKVFTPKDDWMLGKESPKFENEKEPWSPLSLEMPSTQDIESTMNKILQKDLPSSSKNQEVEVGILVENQAVSPFKRTSDSNSSESVPIKKTKTDSLQKLVKAHDIGEIQSSRTRNSLRLSTENQQNVMTNERPTSRRKSKRNVKNSNGDITSYLTRKSTKSKKENIDLKSVPIASRVLRSSLRKSILTETSIRNNPRRSRRLSTEQNRLNIVFTGFESEELEKIIFDLGSEKTNDLTLGNVVVVADKVRRTVKFLCAIGLGLPIVSPKYLLSCKKEEKILNAWDFILQDEEAEEKWNFDLKSSLKRSKNVKLLQGFSVFATENTKPPVKELLAIVECCGGIPLSESPNVWPKKSILLSCLEDKKWWPSPKLRNVKVVHYEFILTGVLRQKIDFKTYELR